MILHGSCADSRLPPFSETGDGNHLVSERGTVNAILVELRTLSYDIRDAEI